YRKDITFQTSRKLDRPYRKQARYQPERSQFISTERADWRAALRICGMCPSMVFRFPRNDLPMALLLGIQTTRELYLPMSVPTPAPRPRCKLHLIPPTIFR